VRNAILGVPHTGDVDFTTGADPLRIIEVLSKAGIKCRFAGEAFGVVLAIEDGVEYEIATFRSERGYFDGRRPSQVTFGVSLEEDLARRDFTINAVAIDCTSGEVVDPFGGVEDLRRGILRTVGNPRERFDEDYLRILRAFRFWGMGFTPVPQLLQEVSRDPSRVSKLAPERVRDELLKIFKRSRQDLLEEILLSTHQTGVLRAILPEVSRLSIVPQTTGHFDSVLEHTIEAVSYSKWLGGDEFDLLAALLHDVGKFDTIGTHPQKDAITFWGHASVGAALANDILRRLRFPKSVIKMVTWLVKNHMTLHSLLNKERELNVFLKRRLVSVPEEWVERLIRLSMADGLAKYRGELPVSIISTFDDVRKTMRPVMKLAISGYDIMRILGIQPSKRVGLVKRKLHELVLTGKLVNDREVLLQYLRRSLERGDV